ncbi:hypothetical protein TL16_g08130 [Triparma laevis f. inornata]|uniref:Uncharacterized protein n=1 Tax=Triparma laevis f. inornata TaxID=1714386 RepID=A0A9W7AZJ2_9STRA|nr:hypothetical protein TL16_g08130 [Triparma laevis f. inornata]
MTQLDLASTNYISSKTLSSYDLYVSPSTVLTISIQNLKLPRPSRIRIDGNLQIDGTNTPTPDLFETSTITVSENGSLTLKGPLKCSKIVVNGLVSTSLGVVCDSLKVGPEGQIKGSVRCTEGEVAEGGMVDSLQMGSVDDDEEESMPYFDEAEAEMLSEMIEEESVRFTQPPPTPTTQRVEEEQVEVEEEEEVVPPIPTPLPTPPTPPQAAQATQDPTEEYDWRGTADLTRRILDSEYDEEKPKAVVQPPPPPSPPATPTTPTPLPSATKFDSFGNPLVSTVELRQEPAPPKTKRWLPNPKPVRLQTPPSPIPSEDKPMLQRGSVTLKDNFDQPLVGSASPSHVNALKLNRIMLQEDRQMINEHLGIVDAGNSADAVVGEVDRPVGEGGYDFREAAGITEKILGRKRSQPAPRTSLQEILPASDKEALFNEAKAIVNKKKRRGTFFKKF